ncbi:MAG TPA: hypothetical protein VJS47_00410 [Rhizomicrobium sp.]|nr:hypothetical protein [Rhizomicrobium sp.]
MQLPKAPAQYDGNDQAQMRGILEREDKRNLKAGTVLEKILLRDSVTGAVKILTVASGTLVIT